eukprot:g1871.t1
MASLSFLNKKGFHTGTFQNQERVWLAEQRKKEEERKLAEKQKELKEERERDEIRKLREKAGIKPDEKDKRIAWMYDHTVMHRHDDDNVDPETKLEKALEEAEASSGSKVREGGVHSVVGTSSSSSSGGENHLSSSSSSAQAPIIPSITQTDDVKRLTSASETFRRVHEDPMFQMQKHRQQKLDSILLNPVKMRAMEKLRRKQLKLERREEKKIRKEKKRARKEMKKKHKEAKKLKKLEKKKKRKKSFDDQDNNETADHNTTSNDTKQFSPATTTHHVGRSRDDDYGNNVPKPSSIDNKCRDPSSGNNDSSASIALHKRKYGIIAGGSSRSDDVLGKEEEGGSAKKTQKRRLGPDPKLLLAKERDMEAKERERKEKLQRIKAKHDRNYNDVVNNGSISSSSKMNSKEQLLAQMQTDAEQLASHRRNVGQRDTTNDERQKNESGNNFLQNVRKDLAPSSLEDALKRRRRV